MRKYLLAFLLVIGTSVAMAQGLIIYKNDGTTINVSSSQLDYIKICNQNDFIDAAYPETLTAETFTLAGYQPKRFDESSGVFLFQLPYDIDRSALTAHFDIKTTSVVSIDGIEQVSDVTTNDFRMPVNYKVETKEGDTFNYTVAIVFSDMPVLYIDTHNTPIASKTEYVENVNLMLFGSAKDAEYGKVKIKGRGNSTWGFPKKSYTVKLDKKDTFAGFKKHKTFALIANYSDKTLMRNSFAYQMGRELFTNMAWNPSTVQAHVIINGNYNGVYDITESVKIDSNRVNIPNMRDCTDVEDAENFGYLIEVNKRLDEIFNFITTHDVYFSLKDPDGDEISTELQEKIQSTTQRAEDALFSNDFTNPDSENYYLNYFDIKSFIDWYWVNELTKNNDADFFSSCYMYYNPSDGKLHMGPLWDFDLSCGNIDFNGTDDPAGLWVYHSSWMLRLLQDPYFASELKARYYELRDRVAEFIDSTLREEVNTITEDAVINFTRWPILGQYVWPNPTGYEDRKTYESEVEYMIDWLKQRIDWIDATLEDQIPS